MALSGEAKREYQRDYMRRRRGSNRFNATHGSTGLTDLALNASGGIREGESFKPQPKPGGKQWHMAPKLVDADGVPITFDADGYPMPDEGDADSALDPDTDEG